MRIGRVFVLGAIVAAAAVWLWRREIEEYVEEKAGKVRDRGGEALRRADEFLEDTREHVSEALQAGRDAIRPRPAARNA
jgi:hypothetical protein